MSVCRLIRVVLALRGRSRPSRFPACGHDLLQSVSARKNRRFSSVQFLKFAAFPLQIRSQLSSVLEPVPLQNLRVLSGVSLRSRFWRRTSAVSMAMSNLAVDMR